jgi:hypothetical protein
MERPTPRFLRSFDHDPLVDYDGGIAGPGNWIDDDDRFLVLGDETGMKDIDRATSEGC